MDKAVVRVQYQPIWQNSFKHLNFNEVKNAYNKAGRRFIFTDFGGTLMEKEKVDLYIKRSFTQTTGKRYAKEAQNTIFFQKIIGNWWIHKSFPRFHLDDRPSEALMKALDALSSDPKNEVFVISGLQLMGLEEVFGHLDRIGLAAANGLYLSMPEADQGPSG